MVDYLLDEDCHTFADFAWSVASGLNPHGKAKTAAKLAKQVKRAKKKDRKKSPDKRKLIVKKIKEIREKKRKIDQQQKTPETKAVSQKLQLELNRLKQQRRKSLPDAVNPARRG